MRGVRALRNQDGEIPPIANVCFYLKSRRARGWRPILTPTIDPLQVAATARGTPYPPKLSGSNIVRVLSEAYVR
jgi:hypothetical protein